VTHAVISKEHLALLRELASRSLTFSTTASIVEVPPGYDRNKVVAAFTVTDFSQEPILADEPDEREEARIIRDYLEAVLKKHARLRVLAEDSSCHPDLGKFHTPIGHIEFKIIPDLLASLLEDIKVVLAERELVRATVGRDLAASVEDGIRAGAVRTATAGLVVLEGGGESPIETAVKAAFDKEMARFAEIDAVAAEQKALAGAARTVSAAVLLRQAVAIVAEASRILGLGPLAGDDPLWQRAKTIIADLEDLIVALRRADGP
jgi:hypothetical protein